MLLPAFFVLATSAVLQEPFTTPDQFGNGEPVTFVTGTAGPAAVTRRLRQIVEAARERNAPGARLLSDAEIDWQHGPAAWPPYAVIHGGPHLNQVTAGLAAVLPFELGPGRLVLGGTTFLGSEYLLYCVVPARAGDDTHPGHPEFKLYAGTGWPTLHEIHSLDAGRFPLSVHDRFGMVLGGTWVRREDGGLDVRFTHKAWRPLWSTVERDAGAFLGDGERPWVVRVHFLASGESTMRADSAVVDEVLRGLVHAARTLGIPDPVSVDVYVYPGEEAKAQVTGLPVPGHMHAASHSLHVVKGGADYERLAYIVPHEGAHLLTHWAWSPMQNEFFSEGLAVWVATRYRGVRLQDWMERLPLASAPPLQALVGGMFREIHPDMGYPLAGIITGTLVAELGLDAVREHLYTARPSTWEEACASLGFTPEELDLLWRRRLGLVPPAGR